MFTVEQLYELKGFKVDYNKGVAILKKNGYTFTVYLTGMMVITNNKNKFQEIETCKGLVEVENIIKTYK